MTSRIWADPQSDMVSPAARTDGQTNGQPTEGPMGSNEDQSYRTLSTQNIKRRFVNQVNFLLADEQI